RGKAQYNKGNTTKALGRKGNMKELLRKMWSDDEGQDIAEYALMLAVILVVVIGAVRLIGTNASNIFNAASDQLTTP
ncbi:MAG: Flp family type IVb pilin, partial [Terriglobales bacterium]